GRPVAVRPDPSSHRTGSAQCPGHGVQHRQIQARGLLLQRVLFRFSRRSDDVLHGNRIAQRLRRCVGWGPDHHRRHHRWSPNHYRARYRRRLSRRARRIYAPVRPVERARRRDHRTARAPVPPQRPARPLEVEEKRTLMLLKATDLHKRFGGLQAVSGVDLTVGEREIVGLIGPNGSGKSTLLSLLMGIHRIDGGTVWIGETDITGWPPHRIARSGMSMMFQHSRPLLQQTVLENVLLALLPDSM